MTQKQPMRLRRSQLAVPGSSEKMLVKAAQSAADHVFCDLEDAVAPTAKPAARKTIVEALNGLNWGRKVRCVRVNDVGTEWCYEDIITVVEGAHANLDTIMLPKPLRPADVVFVDLLLTQLETKLKIKKRIGIELLIEEVQALACVEEIAKASPRIEALIFGMGDYSASHGIDLAAINGASGYPGDIFHYPRFRITMAARAAGVDPVDGPFANFKDEEGFRRECGYARALGMVGKWAIHPSQIAPAIETFTPDPAAVAAAREMAEVYAKAVAEGIGSVNLRGTMVDVATVRLTANLVKMADLIGM
jgi:citrate lyase subunit beta/citryl-CoA lyase